MTAERELDLVLYGATGFVGKLTAEYLARNAPESARIGLGGRSEDRLAKVRGELGARASDWPLVVADSQDADALKTLAQRTTAVATTVGPYRKYGMKLVEACANAGTHYADLTGEVLFIREAIERFHDAAAASGARITTNCGFDSIPSDIGVFLLHEAAQRDGAGELEDTTYVVRAAKGGFSGGTLASAKGQIDEMRADKSLVKVAADPYVLSPARDKEPDLGDESDLRMPKRDAELGMWFGPFVMAGVNTRVVRRSNALLDWAYGRRFRYREVMGFPDGIKGRAMATAVAGGTAAMFGGLALPPTRKVLDRFLPDPGEGPDEEARRKGFFKIDLYARTSSGARYVCHVAAPGDPGYAATAVMLGEAGLCLALDGDALPAIAGGILTPATAMDGALAERLRAAGHTYEVEKL